MKLLRLELRSPEVLGDFAVSFSDDNEPRPVTVIHGGPGSGKTSIVNALVCTRPGHSVAMSLRPFEPKQFASVAWQLGMDEPDRNSPFVVVSPNAPDDLFPRTAEQRREQVFFDRLSKEGGFVCLAFSSLRWFSKGPVVLGPPETSISRYDVREFLSLDDAARQDLARECKQTLTYASIVEALSPVSGAGEREARLGASVRHVVSAIAQIMGYRYLGASPRSLSPIFEKNNGDQLPFDALPTQLKHMVAFGVLPLRALWAAYPELEPRRAPAVVIIDQLELQLEEGVALSLLQRLTEVLPEVQWVVTTRSASLLASREPHEVLALRRNDEAGEVSVYLGADAQLH